MVIRRTYSPEIGALDQRNREIFREVVESFLETGTPVGSRTLSRRLNSSLSPASVRNIMADLEDAGLLHSPHTSAGRLPTDAGLRLFVDGLLEIGNLTVEERDTIESQCAGTDRSLETLLEEATAALSGLSRCAGLVMAPKADSPLRHIEFVSFGPGRVMVVLVNENGVVENRIVEVPHGLPPSALVEASNYLSARLVGHTVPETAVAIKTELDEHRAQLDALTTRVVEAGLATWAGGEKGGSLIIRGQANLLDDVTAVADLERIRALFAALETKETLLRLLSLADTADGVRIFVGADNQLFSVSGCSMIVSSYHDARERIVGAIGVIGPTRMNYARIIPMVDYTAKLIGRLIG